jgi:predicted HicB family RNase H-like nuclease
MLFDDCRRTRMYVKVDTGSNRRLSVRVDESWFQQASKIAAERGITISEWVRDCCYEVDGVGDLTAERPSNR